uniref:non-specific serine/threonine protein kinase n=1 Tax=Caenorhabditis japonica TaxID=281687 RepID=A0A8R1HYH6_CAEJA
MPSKEDDDVMKNVTFKEGKRSVKNLYDEHKITHRFGDWRTGPVLDEGGFGKVYLVKNDMDPTKTAALKAESNTVEGGSAIKLELQVLQRLNEGGPAPHIPVLYLAGKRKNYCFMVMTLLGSNLKQLRVKNTVVKNGFSRGTWSRVGIQCLYGLKYVHDHGYIHRDLKPANFLLGNPKDKDRARIVHILDFGLARMFAAFTKGKWEVRKARGTAEFRGTLPYVSPNMSLKKEQGRGDDVWSLLYVLIELNGGKRLPWQGESERERVEQMKQSLPHNVVMQNMPPCMSKLMPHLASLNYYQRPDYHMFFKALRQVMDDEKVTPLSKYDWETENPDKSVAPASWEEPTGSYFVADPLAIDGPPAANPNEPKTDHSRGSYSNPKNK